MSHSPARIALVERDLRAAARAFDDVPVSSDAWQRNQLRLAANRGRRGRTLLAVAAALVLVVAVGALVLGGGNGGKRTLPGGSGGGDPFGDSVVLGPPVDVETVTIDGVETTHQAVLSDQTGKGPNLCDRYLSGTGANGGCSSREANADNPDVAFDWLTATTGGGDIRGVLAGVDSRVSQVRIWMSNGDQTLARLKPAGWEGTQIFGLTVPADGPRPQRLVAYGRPGVLQTVDLASLGGRMVASGPCLRPGADHPAARGAGPGGCREHRRQDLPAVDRAGARRLPAAPAAGPGRPGRAPQCRARHRTGGRLGRPGERRQDHHVQLPATDTDARHVVARRRGRG
jgi:hypothetical protein